MTINRKNEPITITYSNGKIKLYNDDRSIAAVLDLPSNELKKMYFGGEGTGTLHIQVSEIEKDG